MGREAQGAPSACTTSQGDVGTTERNEAKELPKGKLFNHRMFEESGVVKVEKKMYK